MPLPTLYQKGYLIGTGLENEVPLDYIMNWFLTTNDRILILQSSTGSGKSTVLPPEFFEQVNSTKYVACTQPLVKTATSLPELVEPFFQDKRIPLTIGYNLGFQTGVISKNATVPGVVYITTGVLYSQLLTMDDNEIIDKYSCIFIDEAHTRATELDITLYLMKQFLKNNKDNKNCPFVVIMSATLDIPKFAEYFDTKNIIEVKGTSYPIEEFFIETDSQNISNDIVTQIVKYHEKNIDQKVFVDILVFLAGIVDIDKVFMELTNAKNKNYIFKKYPILILKVTKDTIDRHAREIDADIMDIHITVDGVSVNPFRRIFLATNVIETGLTLKNLVCVIDAGYYKSAEYDPIYESYLLISKPVTQSMHIQRKGRVGRINKGDCITMFTKKTFDILYKDQFPNIIKSDSIVDVLNIIMNLSNLPKNQVLYNALQNFEPSPANVFDVDLLEQPGIYSINNSLNILFYLGALDKNKLLTPVGLIMGRFKRIGLPVIKMMLMGFCYSNVAIIDLVNIAAYLTEDSNLNVPSKNIEAPQLNDSFINAIYFMEDLLEGNLAAITEFIKIIEIRENIIGVMISLGFNPFKNYNKRLIMLDNVMEKISYIKTLKTCIYEGFKMNIIKKVMNGEYYNYYNRLGSLVKVSGINMYQMKPEYAVYYQLSMKQDNKTRKFLYKANKTCILDGCVNVDVFFDVNV